ncbi:PREDICTED: uncharacterized protein LOC105448005 [Wasmannia auropunctata]|uniref:uncharacterized protein LOC105448005 n=1 Tax=Wasmannia auropunctata TaxID=64793 RepID=UPI0005F031BC|nr:PREDICTED: uncharacterized protein LOC105448005 [Wasmannia auropunctata]
MTIKKVTINVLMFFILANHILRIFGKVTLLRASPFSSKPDNVKLICLSEDDGGALVWNNNLIWSWKEYSPKENNLQFHNLNKLKNNKINCEMNANEGCLESWNKQNWTFTNSLKTPMGPVFGQRWEKFKQYDHLQYTYDYVHFNLSTEVKLPFSVRVSHDAQILICNSKNFARDSCYWIIIGGWNNTKSVIQKCATGVPVLGKRRVKNCKTSLTSFNHTPLSKNEWRSFVITWNPTTRRIIVYDTDKLIMEYTDEERHLRSSNDYYMFIRTYNTAMLFRFHIYDFLHTTVENAVLTSPIFQFNNKMMCVQLFVGLCTECDARIVLRDYINDEELVMVTVEGSSKITAHGLPMWQSVKINRNSTVTNYNTNNKVIIQLIPKLNKYSSNPLWAIANVRQCPQNGALRKGVMITNQDWDSHYFWPIETCQKLFYDEHVVVNHLSRMKSDINLDDANCFQGKIGSQCLFSCESDLNSDSNCTGAKICYENGCTCAPGVLGDNCLKTCDTYTYSYGCKKTCGACFYNKQCNIVTGVCDKGCDNTDNEIIYIPPLCQTSVDRPNIPTISLNETTICATVLMTWKNEYEKIPIYYSLFIQGQIKYQWNKLLRNMTQLTEYFVNLEPGFMYYVGFSLDINAADSFDLTPEENGMIIDWRINPNQLYLCPARWYYVVVRNIYTNNIVFSTLSITHFPYKLQFLPSYTSFEVTIFYKDDKLFSQEIRTLEGVPSRVSELQKMFSSNTQLTLIWKPPHKPNGKIVRYEVILKVMQL